MEPPNRDFHVQHSQPPSYDSADALSANEGRLPIPKTVHEQLADNAQLHEEQKDKDEGKKFLAGSTAAGVALVIVGAVVVVGIAGFLASNPVLGNNGGRDSIFNNRCCPGL